MDDRKSARAARRLQNFAIAADERIDAARLRFRQRFGTGRAEVIVPYRGHADGHSVHLSGRVLSSRPGTGALDGDKWWDNLLDTWRRFESDEVADAELVLRFRGIEMRTRSDGEGYYDVELPLPAGTAAADALWEDAEVRLADGDFTIAQPVLQVCARAALGVISDIDDTILFSSVLEWKTAAQLALLGNARTRKPLAGVATLYRALQGGATGEARNPVFYVSSSPWNMYDLLEDFIALNGIPAGPIFLRDLGLDPGKFLATPGHGHKLQRARALIARYPELRWVLVGDSGQADAELYAEAAREFGDRIAAIYIRDVAPDRDDPRDVFVDTHIGHVAGTNVPMLRVRDSLDIGEHAASLGLLAEAALDAIAKDVQRDRSRPTQQQAVAAAKEELRAEPSG